MTEDKALLPCPFCGGEVKISRAHQIWMSPKFEQPQGDEMWSWTLHHNCDGRTDITWAFQPKATLIAAWNRRAGQAEADARVKALEAALKDPATIHANMLRGSIAKLSPETWAHTHGLTSIDGWQDMTLRQISATLKGAGHE